MSAASRLGVLVLVVGPSGAGKDTLMSAARERLKGDGRFVFVRRIVTRAENAFEDHDTLSAEQFAATAAAGGFAVHWQAHGLSYGINRSVEDELAAGRIVVCNVSRAIIPAARERYRNVMALYVDAQSEVRAARIAARGRDVAAGSRTDPLRTDVSPGDCDVVVDNSGALDAAIATFTQALLACAEKSWR